VKDKNRKWLHAIAIDPVAYMSREALVEEPADCTDSPYEAFSSSKRQGDGGGGAGKKENDDDCVLEPLVAMGTDVAVMAFFLLNLMKTGWWLFSS